MQFSRALKHKTVLAAFVAGFGYHGACSAAIGYDSVNGGELFLDVINTTVSVSATFDLAAPTFASHPGFAVDPTIQTFDVVALSEPGVRLTWDLSGTAAWSSFVHAAGTSLGDSKFDIKAVGPSDPDNSDKVIFLTTASSSDLSHQSFIRLREFGLVGETFVAATNQEPTHNAQLNGANFATSANPSLYHEIAVGDSWMNALMNGTVTSTGPIGVDLHFYQLYGTAQSTTTSVGPYAGVWNLSQAGLLSYTTAPVPEPASAAMLAAGLAVVGALVHQRRRRRERLAFR